MLFCLPIQILYHHNNYTSIEHITIIYPALTLNCIILQRSTIYDSTKIAVDVLGHNMLLTTYGEFQGITTRVPISNSTLRLGNHE